MKTTLSPSCTSYSSSPSISQSVLFTRTRIPGRMVSPRTNSSGRSWSKLSLIHAMRSLSVHGLELGWTGRSMSCCLTLLKRSSAPPANSMCTFIPIPWIPVYAKWARNLATKGLFAYLRGASYDEPRPRWAELMHALLAQHTRILFYSYVDDNDFETLFQSVAAGRLRIRRALRSHRRLS